ncbi:hypothetical protein T484DRAFT_1819702 [Baffinella frigidus]|nr:hypothetical protein T484DRAFT_1819702 [Cryptophyta sp. CCMP2293]
MRGARLAVLGVAMAAVLGMVALSMPGGDPVALEGPPLSLNSVSGPAVSGMSMVPLQSLAKKPAKYYSKADRDYWVTTKGDLVYVQKRGAPIVTIVNTKTNDVKHLRVDGKERFAPVKTPTAVNSGDSHSYFPGWWPSPHQKRGDGITESRRRANYRRHLENFKRYMGMGAKGLAGESVVHAAQR